VKKQEQRPDTKAILSGLKDFQRKTVEFVYRRMYTDDDRVNRFLVADEVGLGKTLVAPGLIAKAIDHLWPTDRRIDVVYVCSNAEIARQNIGRLNVTEQKNCSNATRITLLAITLRQLSHYQQIVTLIRKRPIGFPADSNWMEEQLVKTSGYLKINPSNFMR